MNQITIIGNLTKDVELLTTPSGTPVARFSIAVSRDYTNSAGEKITDYFNIVAWRGLAENCSKFLSKGKKVGVIGRLENRSYDDKNGAKKSISEVVAEKVEFLSPKEDKPKKAVPEELLPFEEDDLPF